MVSTTSNNKFWREFIQLYRALPQLWKIGTEDYKNRELKREGYDILVAKMKLIEPKADRDMVRKKINCLRTSYRRELKKIYELGLDNKITSLWYFEDIDFLRDSEIQINSNAMINGSEEIDSKDNVMMMEDPLIVEPEQLTCTPLQSTIKINDTYSLDQASVSSSPSSKRKSTFDPEDCGKRNKSVDSGHLHSSDNEAELLGKIWTMEYKKLQPEQQIHAKKWINDILYEGRLGNLHRHSFTINYVESDLLP